ncbi:MAG: hypothetical protein IPJ75_02820 [Ignavibacteriales bacterium]|nr:hypothetical protein [Ignavibacteriales bacterium]
MVHNNANSNKRLKLIDGVVLALSVFTGIILFLIGTSKYGIGLTGDTMNYIALSTNLLEGEGFVGLGGTPFVLWPPGYSLIILFVKVLTGLDYYLILSSLNILSLSLTFILSYLIFKQKFESSVLRYYGLGLLIIAPGVYLVWVFAFSEIVFIPIMLLFLFLCEKWRDDLSTKRVILLSVLIVLLFFVKYIGIVVFPLVIYLIYRGDKKSWFFKSIVASVVTLIPVLLWILRNYYLAGSPFGERGESIYSILEVKMISMETFLYWVFPVLMLVPILILFAARSLKIIDVPFSQVFGRIDIPLIFITLFLIGTFISTAVSAFDRLNNRLLFPAFIPLLIVFLIVLGILQDNLSKWENRKFLVVAGLILMLIPVGVYLRTDLRSFSTRIQKGAGGISTDEFQARLPNLKGEMVKKLKSENNIYSNNPELLFYATYVQTKKSPRKFFTILMKLK